MELKFEKKSSNFYVAEFKATGDFNLHVEREDTGYFSIEQRGTEKGKYASIKGDEVYRGMVIDFDVLGMIYPKYIQVRSATKPTFAVVTFRE